MLFNSFAFLVFFPLVYIVYWWLKGHLRAQNIFLLVVSYFFYGWWDPRFLVLILFSSVTDLLIGRMLDKSKGTARRKLLLLLSMGLNLGLLGTFKYYDFFVSSFAELLTGLGFQPHISTLQIILPVGISFYTFQTMSYTIDIYRRQIRSTKDPITFLAFVSFFPQLVAGPIERARDLLPQFERERQLSYDAARNALRQILWGFFKKIAIADNCAPLVNTIFELEPSETSGITLFFGAFFFAFQIYGDFSGYSDIAIGTARLLGFNLTQNFAYPYFSRSISEFWRRWHISLSSWFRDYVYIPLGGSRSEGQRMRNLMITFAVSGLWHGANWTFIVWGILHGLFHLPTLNKGPYRPKTTPSFKELPRILFTFGLVTVAWIFFRAASVSVAIEMIMHMFGNAFQHPGAVLIWLLRGEILLILFMLATEWGFRTELHALKDLRGPVYMRWVIYMVLILIILVNLNTQSSREFIYFQF